MSTSGIKQHRDAAKDKVQQTMAFVRGVGSHDQVYIACRCIDWIARNPVTFETFDRERWLDPTRFVDVYKAIDEMTGGELTRICPDTYAFAFLFGMARAAWLMTTNEKENP